MRTYLVIPIVEKLCEQFLRCKWLNLHCLLASSVSDNIQTWVLIVTVFPAFAFCCFGGEEIEWQQYLSEGTDKSTGVIPQPNNLYRHLQTIDWRRSFGNANRLFKATPQLPTTPNFLVKLPCQKVYDSQICDFNVSPIVQLPTEEQTPYGHGSIACFRHPLDLLDEFFYGTYRDMSHPSAA